MRGEVRAGGRHEGVGRRRRKRHARGGPDSKGWGQRARAERTWNICCMYVTLDVSKLSGWLNAAADCRVERRAYDAERGVDRGRESVGRRQLTSGAYTARGPSCEGWGGYRECAERT